MKNINKTNKNKLSITTNDDDNLFVIRDNKTNKWVNIDPSSGGYPYYTDLKHAKIFFNKEDANTYKKTMKKDWSLFKLSFIVKPENWN